LKARIPSYASEDMIWYAVARSFAPDFWSDLQSVRKHYEVETYQGRALDNLVATIRAFNDALDIRAVSGYVGATLSLCESSADEHWKHPTRSQTFHLREAKNMLLELRRKQNDPDESFDTGCDYCLAWCGKAGTGKSAMVKNLLAWCEEQGMSAKVACPTGRQSSYCRHDAPGLTVDTLHGTLSWYKRPRPPAAAILNTNVLFVEEYGQLQEELGADLMKQWFFLKQMCLIVFVGDETQLSPVSGLPFHVHRLWQKHVKKRELKALLRAAADNDLQKWLRHLSLYGVTKFQLADLLRRRKFGSYTVKASDILALYRKFPHTTIVTWSLRKASWVNEVLVAELFAEDRELGTEVFAPDKDQADSHCKVCFVYKGMRVILVINRNKRIGFVNGMGAIILAREGAGYRVRNDLGNEFSVYPYTDEYKRVYYPWRLGYAVNLSKVQGETISHLSFWLDTKGIPAAFYVGLSRVRSFDDIVFLGYLTPEHVVPAVKYELPEAEE
jgi:hypothetical protein